MEKEIKEIIKKNLPAQTGEILRERLEQAEEDARQLISLRDQLKQSGEFVASLEAKVAEYKSNDERNANLEKREIAVFEGERNLRIKELEYQINSERMNTHFAREVALGLVRNSQYRKQITETKTTE